MPHDLHLLPGPLYRGACDASSAIAAGEGRIIVADDEQKCLRIYSIDGTGRDLAPPLPALLDMPKNSELDLEASAQIGDTVYWCGSHSRDEDGRPRQSGHTLFGTHIDVERAELSLAGDPFRDLYDRLDSVINLPPRDKKLDKDEKPRDLDIEGMAASPDGELLLGLRCPLIDGKALVIPIGTLDRVRPRKPIRLDLHHRGIRSFEYWPDRRCYLLIAGPSGDEETAFSLYRWSGSASDEPEELIELDGWLRHYGVDPKARAEAIIIHPGAGVQILMDEGKVGKPKCKDRSRDQQGFHSFWVTGL